MQQQQLGFVDRDELIVKLCLPKSKTVSDGAVKSRVMRAVLLRLNQHLGNKQETFVGQRRLADETEYGINTVARALEALEALGIITRDVKKSDRSRRPVTHYTIDWHLVRQLAQVRQHPELAQAEQPQEQRRSDPPQVGLQSTGSDPPVLASNPPKRLSDPPKIGSDPPADGVRPYRPERQVKDSMREGGVLEMCSRKVERSEVLPRGLVVSDLCDAEKVQQLWLRLMANGVLPATELWRRRWFGLCYSVWRNRAAFRNPPGMLVSKLKQGEAAILSQVDDEHDREWAKRAIADVDGVVLVGSPQHQASSAISDEVLAESESCEQFERRRSEQMRQLWQAVKRGDVVNGLDDKGKANRHRIR